MYIAREYEKIIPVKKRYQSKLIPIPTPEFIVFYNGVQNYPVEETLRLSTAFTEKDGMPSLELVVRVININPKKKHEILKKCPILREYSEFVEITRKYKDDKNQLEKAVKQCIDNGILADYLSRKSSEVINLLLDEYSYETDIEVQREEAAEDACEKLKVSYQKYLEAKKKHDRS